MTDLLERTTIDEPTIAAPAPPPVKTPSEVLLHAARYIEEHGWIQHDILAGDGRACAVGAMMQVAYGPRLPDRTWGASGRYKVDKSLYRARDKVDRYVRSISTGRIATIVMYNDDRATKSEDVVRILRAAAELPDA